MSRPQLCGEFETSMRQEIKNLERLAGEEPSRPEVRAALDYYWFHANRWIATFNLLAPHLGRGAGILEVGDISKIGNFLLQHGFEVHSTTGDLSYPLADLESARYDAVLCMEVIEHIKDQFGSSPMDEFNMSGAKCLAREMKRGLKPGGVMVCTTPNGHSYAQIARIALSRPPAFHRGHVREYTVVELRSLFEGVGFQCLSIDTPPGVWGADPALNIDAAKAYVVSIGGDPAYREEDIMAIFQRPA